MTAEPQDFLSAHPDETAVPTAQTSITCFSLRAAADPGVMPRVLEVFAKRSLVPSRWHADKPGGPHGDELAIDIQVADLSPEEGAFLARCLRQIYGVDAVLTAEKGYA